MVKLVRYASFWDRVLAFIIDDLLLVFTVWILSLSVNGFLGVVVGARADKVFSLIFAVSYYVFLESSVYQGSVGKMFMGLKVTSLKGKRISWWTALVRRLSWYVSGAIFLIGYLMYFFTKKKQCLHDLVANTLVVKK